MSKFCTLVFAGLAMSSAHLALAQTSAVANLSVLSGNGEVACDTQGPTFQVYNNAPISVKATNASGSPVSGATVTWTLGTVQGESVSLASPTSITDSNGIATNNISLNVLINIASPSVPYILDTIQAASNNSSVTFTETQSLLTAIHY